MKVRAFEWLWDIHGYPNLFCHLSFQTGISRGSLSFFTVFLQEPAAGLLSLECSGPGVLAFTKTVQYMWMLKCPTGTSLNLTEQSYGDGSNSWYP